MLSNAQEIQTRLERLGDPEKAQIHQRFFKTGPGEYGEGDVFLGISVPETRKLAREYQTLSLPETIKFLQSPLHEARQLALFILVRAYAKGDAALQEQIYHLYLQNARFINNWDLVDVSAEHIVGPWLRRQSKAPLHILAASELVWERRIAIMATFHYIKKGEFDPTLRIAELLLADKHDLIHKATGWMLREIGKRNLAVEESFLKAHYRQMPRTMLRYAIEKFPEDLRQQYLRGESALVSSKKEGSSNSEKQRDPDFINAEIAMKRAAQKARKRALQAGIGVMVYRDGRIIEEKPDLEE
ncbi:MAG: DNA alkylation repair protein [Syntrophus sp. (in: bacteria)]